MWSFRKDKLEKLHLPAPTVWMLESLAEYKGKEELYTVQAPQLLQRLRETAIIQSAESSNRIEGVTVDRERLRPLVLGNTAPRDRSEEEVAGYRAALDLIHRDPAALSVTPDLILRLHAVAQGGMSGDAGEWKKRPNDIIEIAPDGRRTVRFSPLAPALVPAAVAELCDAYGDLMTAGRTSPLVAAAAFVLDFLCIHPFRDGNGRVSRLATLLLSYQGGYGVGRYISIERIVEETKESYYAALKASSDGWHTGEHDLLPWANYLFSTLRTAYREFGERAHSATTPRGSKSEQIEAALEAMPALFSMSEMERACPNASREMIRIVMRRWKEAGRIVSTGRGRDARWKKNGAV